MKLGIFRQATPFDSPLTSNIWPEHFVLDLEFQFRLERLSSISSCTKKSRLLLFTKKTYGFDQSSVSSCTPEFHQNHWFLCPNSVNNLLINQSGLIIHCTAFPFWHFPIHHEWGLLWTHPMSSDPWSISSLSSMTCQSENICHHRHYHHHNKSLSINTSITNMMIITRTTMAGQKYNKTIWVEPSIDCHQPETDWNSLLIIILATRTSSWGKQ